MEYYSAVKKNGLLIYSTAQMNLKALHWIREARHKKVHTVCMIPFLQNSRKGETVIKSRSMAAKSWRLGRWLNRNDLEGTFWSDGNALYFYCGSVYMTVHISQNSLNFTLKIDEFYYM